VNTGESGIFAYLLIDVVKIQHFYNITKPWLEKVGALRQKKENVPILTHPLFSFHPEHGV
jgi:hypothetical protein